MLQQLDSTSDGSARRTPLMKLRAFVYPVVARWSARPPVRSRAVVVARLSTVSEEDNSVAQASSASILRFERQPFAGTFTIKDTALYLRATTPPARVPISFWKRHRPEQFVTTSRALYAWIRLGLEWDEPLPVSSRDRVITFEDLVRMRVIALFRSRGFSYRDIRSSEDFVRQEMGLQQPFVTENFWTADRILMEFEGHLLAVSPGRLQMGFAEFNEFFHPVENGLAFNKYGIAERWSPSPNVLIDPTTQFGAPCVEGTRVSTETLWSFHQAGDSIVSLAKMYEIDLNQVEAALDWESRIAAAMAA